MRTRRRVRNRVSRNTGSIKMGMVDSRRSVGCGPLNKRRMMHWSLKAVRSLADRQNMTGTQPRP